MGTNFFAQRSGCAILHPPYEHEYASGEEKCHHRSKYRETTPEAEIHLPLPAPPSNASENAIATTWFSW